MSRIPIPTPKSGPVPHFHPKPQVILFDVYGTLVAARYGDLEEQMRRNLAQESFMKTARFFGFSEKSGFLWADLFCRAVMEEHEHARAIGISRPEILVEEIWKKLMHSVPEAPNPEPHPMDVAMYRELVANPVAPYEGVAEMLKALRRRGYLLGLASNAQFYTRAILEYILESPLDAVFDARWTFFSYELGFAKPDPHFFRIIATRARRFSLEPQAVLMVGNDPFNDMEAATVHGLQAVLFLPVTAASPQSSRWGGPCLHRFDTLVQALANG
ncbi:MAG: HAD family hydrolase [Desulfosoma sp.]